MKIKIYHWIFILFFAQSKLFSQVPDSLKTKYAKANHDTVRISVLIEMANSVLGSNPPEAITYCLRSKELSEKIHYNNGLATSLGWLAFLYGQTGKLDLEMDYYKKSITLFKEIGDENSIATTYFNMASAYGDQGDIPKGLEYNHLALASFEKMGDKKGIALVFNNLAGFYMDQEENEKAKEYLLKALEIRLKLNNKGDIAESYNNVGHFYDKKMGDLKLGLSYYKKSNEMFTELNDKRGIAFSLHNMGSIYSRSGDTTKALEAYYRAIEIKESVNNIEGLPSTLMTIANILAKQNKINEAEKLLNRSLQIGQSMNSPETISSSAILLKKIYQKQNKFEKALEMFELYKLMRDTIFNQTNRKAAYKAQLKYDFNKRETELKAEQEKENLLAESKQQKQKYIIWSVIGGIVIVGFFLVIIFNKLQLTKKQKNIIEEQKGLVEEQQKEIIDSINYAKRIQYALLASNNLLNNNLEDYFIYFKPKNVVSGDFYWATQTPDGFIFILGDCTGHGVPGAFMSLLNISKLNQTINENKITSPDLILNNVRKEIIQSLNPDGTIIESKDGMDAVICKLDIKNLKLQYAAANNPFYIIRNNELKICEADKMPVGVGHDDNKLFTLKEIELKKNDMIYMFSDGYADQFGGPKGKKFMYKKLNELLLSINTKPTAEQKTLIIKTINDWRGDLEQVDDISVVGIRV